MLLKSSKKKHLAMHMPGHKAGKWDITELSYSDNLCAPKGCIGEAEKDIAAILGAEKSFILTDGSTSGVLSILYAAKRLGVKKIALTENAHKSVFNGCSILGLSPLIYQNENTMSALNELFQDADALFITSPDYYGRVANLQELRRYCDERSKLLLVDGAHGGHLHFDTRLYAGSYADMWVDGVHKSLPALNQGAIVSAKSARFVEALAEGVSIFRTTSPSYPIMASVEYAVKYPRNLPLEGKVREFASGNARVEIKDDWAKVLLHFGENAFAASEEMERLGVYPELCDGNVVEFYLSPATSMREWKRAEKVALQMLAKYPHTPKKEIKRVPAPLVFPENRRKEWVELAESVGKICAADCGAFPPCTPLIRAGEKITEEKLALLQSANHLFGTVDGKIRIYGEEE